MYIVRYGCQPIRLLDSFNQQYLPNQWLEHVELLHIHSPPRKEVSMTFLDVYYQVVLPEIPKVFLAWVQMSHNHYLYVVNYYNFFSQGQGAVRSEVQLEMNRLLDTIHITLTDMEVFSALKLDSEDSKNGRVEYKRQGHEMMEEPCTLELTLERNLEWMFGRQGKNV